MAGEGHGPHGLGDGMMRMGVQVYKVTPLADSVASSGVADTVARGRSTLALHRGPGRKQAAGRQRFRGHHCHHSAAPRCERCTNYLWVG